MKKITFLLFIFAVSLGYSQTLPFDFSNPNQAFTAVNTTSTTIVSEPGNATNDVLQIVGPGVAWDNSEIVLSTPIDLSNSASNSISFRFKTDGDYGTRRHLMKLLGGSAGGVDIELFFELDAGTDWQTISLDANDAPQFNAALASFEKLLLFTDAGDGNTGTYYFDDISAPEAAPETCSDGILNQDETGVDCGGSMCAPCDVAAPTAFTATLGTVDAFSVELLLTATDDSGMVTYDVSYDGGASTAQTTGTTGVETSFIISGLTPETAYSFEVSASDASGNVAANNAISLSATTLADASTACAGFTNEISTDSSASYSVGINYDFQTVGTDVLVSFELLDTDKPGFSPQLFFAPSTFVNMDASAAPIYTATLTGNTLGETISFTFRGAFAGGLVNSKVFDYVVGDDCSTAGLEDFAANAVKMYPNPAKGFVNFSSASSEALDVAVYNLLGKEVLRVENVQSQLNISSLNPGVYFVSMTQGSRVSTKKLLVN